MEKAKIIFCTIFSGLVLALAHNYLSLWSFSLVGLLPVLYIIYSQNLKHYQNFLVGFFAGFIMLAGVMYWHWNILPLDWAGIDNPVSEFVLVFYIWVLSSVTAGLVGFWTLGLGYLKKNNWFDFLLAPALWVVIEFLRSIVVSLLWNGSGATLGPHWSISFLGYDLGSSSLLLPFASLGGVYFLSFIVVLFNIILFFYLKDFLGKRDVKKYYKLVGYVFAVIVAFNIFYNLVPQKPAAVFPFAVLNTYLESFSRLSEDEFSEINQSQKDLLSQIKNSGNDPSVVVFPEDSRFLLGLSVFNEQDFINEIFGDKEVLIVDSARISREADRPIALTFTFLNTKVSRIVYSDKQYLVPHGEYMPYISSHLLKFTGNKKWLDSFNSARGFAKGKNVTLTDFKGFRIGSLACSEIMSPSFNRNLAEEGTSVIINTASHSLFNGSYILYNQTVNMAKLRAIENNRYYIHAGNFVPSFVVDNRGRMLAESSWDEPGIVYQDVGIINRNSFYNGFGRWVFPLIYVLIVLFAILDRVGLKWAKFS